MKTISVTELLCVGFEAHELGLHEKIKASAEYQKAEEVFLKHIDSIRSNDYSCASEIEESVSVMESVAKDTGFDEGFKLAVRLISSSLS